MNLKGLNCEKTRQTELAGFAIGSPKDYPMQIVCCGEGASDQMKLLVLRRQIWIGDRLVSKDIPFPPLMFLLSLYKIKRKMQQILQASLRFQEIECFGEFPLPNNHHIALMNKKNEQQDYILPLVHCTDHQLLMTDY